MLVSTLIVTCAAVLALAIPFSMVGQGGGSFYVPVLLITGMEMHEASTTSLFMVMFSGVSASLVFGRKKIVDWKLLLAIVPFAIVGSFIGGFAAQWVSGLVLKIIFAVVLGIAAVFMLRPATEGKCPDFMPECIPWNRTCGEFKYRISIGLVIPLTLLVGFVAGMIGVGGGIFLVPMLVLLFGCPTRIAVGLSSIYVGVASLSGFLGHVIGGNPFDILVALPLAVAVFIGARVGPILSLKTSVPKLRVTLAIVLTALAVWMIANLFI